ncbi:universal stress protein [Limimaricola hongkongensis]|nr:universal stress protein [Limimaricola hongkongensis]
MKTIVAATDFSKAGNQAVLRGAAIAAHTGGRLHIFHAANFRIAAEQKAHFNALVEGYFDTLRARIQCRYGSSLQVSHTYSGDWQDIYAILKRKKANLLVAGQHVHPNGIDMFHGTFVERLTADCPVPVLVSLSAPETPYRRVLVAVAPGPASETAIPVIRAIAPHSAIELIQVVPLDRDAETLCGSASGAATSVTPEQDTRAIEDLREKMGLALNTEMPDLKGDPRIKIRQKVSSDRTELIVFVNAGAVLDLKDSFIRTPPCDLLVCPTIA